MSHDWQRICDTHGPLVWKAIYRLLRTHAESMDCYQDVMLEAFQHSHSNTIKNWPGYLRWLAVRRGLDRLRKRKRNGQIIDVNQDVVQLTSNNSAPDRSIEIEELKDRLRNALLDLPKQQAEAFWLRSVEQMSYEEIASRMKADKNSVGVWIHRARASVRQQLSDLQPKQMQPAGSFAQTVGRTNSEHDNDQTGASNE